MASDRGPGFDSPGSSHVCAHDAHQECGHVNGVVRMTRPGPRLESTVALCRCSCHAACPLADRMPVPLAVWQQLCACPGADKQREWKEDPDEPVPGFREFRENHERESRERRESHSQAVHAAQAAASGKTRDQVRDLYLTELRARGVDEPRDVILEATLDLLTGHPITANSRVLLGYGKAAARLAKWFWSAFPPDP